MFFEDYEDTVKGMFYGFSAEEDLEDSGMTDADREEISDTAGTASDIDNIQWYLTDNELVVIFNRYDIAGYAFGPTAVQIPFETAGKRDLFMTIECSQSVHSIVMGFILLRVLEFFVFRKMEMPETKNHLLCGWRQSVVQKITFPLQQSCSGTIVRKESDFMANKNYDLAHTKWMCKYHIVFTPKYRRKLFIIN